MLALRNLRTAGLAILANTAGIPLNMAPPEKETIPTNSPLLLMRGPPESDCGQNYTLVINNCFRIIVKCGTRTIKDKFVFHSKKKAGGSQQALMDYLRLSVLYLRTTLFHGKQQKYGIIYSINLVKLRIHIYRYECTSPTRS